MPDFLDAILALSLINLLSAHCQFPENRSANLIISTAYRETLSLSIKSITTKTLKRLAPRTSLDKFPHYLLVSQ